MHAIYHWRPRLLLPVSKFHKNIGNISISYCPVRKIHPIYYFQFYISEFTKNLLYMHTLYIFFICLNFNCLSLLININYVPQILKNRSLFLIYCMIRKSNQFRRNEFLVEQKRFRIEKSCLLYLSNVYFFFWEKNKSK